MSYYFSKITLKTNEHKLKIVMIIMEKKYIKTKRMTYSIFFLFFLKKKK